jgi:uncharacterized RDD family membrane protein YckC
VTRSDERAHLHRIIGSVIYDWLVLLGLLMIFGFIGVAVNHSLTGEESIKPNNHLFQLYILAVVVCYYTYFWQRSGQTVGMKAWKLKLQSIDQQPINFKQTCIRLIVAMPAYLLGLLGILWVYTPTARTWQGIASGTQLIYIPKK